MKSLAVFVIAVQNLLIHHFWETLAAGAIAAAIIYSVIALKRSTEPKTLQPHPADNSELLLTEDKRIRDTNPEEKMAEPRMAARLGHVLYWIGCACAVLALIIGAGFLPYIQAGSKLAAATLIWGVALIFWLIGRALQYILAGAARRRLNLRQRIVSFWPAASLVWVICAIAMVWDYLPASSPTIKEASSDGYTLMTDAERTAATIDAAAAVFVPPLVALLAGLLVAWANRTRSSVP